MNMTITFGEAVIYSVLGLSVVFFALVLLLVMIKVLVALTDGRKKAEPAPAAAAAAPVEKKLAPGTAGELKLYDTEPRTAAMLMAIVADELKAPLNELRFISIREIKEKD